MSNVCEHGQLARVCNICELTARIKELEQQLEQPKRKWRGLTRKERSELWWATDMSGMPEHDYGKAIEAKLKEKNT